MPYKNAKYGEELTETEVKILKLVAEGLHSATIGKALFLSNGSVHNYIYAIYKKLGAKNRAHAVAIGFRTRILR